MLELRPTCEHCNKALPPASTEAMICTFECTFCCHCVESVLENVCPNCGGGFARRPNRPANNLKGDNYLGKHPAGGKTVFQPVDIEAHQRFAAGIKNTAPEDR
jgi:hypothetical protein